MSDVASSEEKPLVRLWFMLQQYGKVYAQLYKIRIYKQRCTAS